MRGPITSARRRALDVLGWRGSAVVGMGMYTCTEHNPTVSPAAESWLLDMGFAVTTWIDGKRGVSITPAGVDMLDEVFA